MIKAAFVSIGPGVPILNLRKVTALCVSREGAAVGNNKAHQAKISAVGRTKAHVMAGKLPVEIISLVSLNNIPVRSKIG